MTYDAEHPRGVQLVSSLIEDSHPGSAGIERPPGVNLSRKNKFTLASSDHAPLVSINGIVMS